MRISTLYDIFSFSITYRFFIFPIFHTVPSVICRTSFSCFFYRPLNVCIVSSAVPEHEQLTNQIQHASTSQVCSFQWHSLNSTLSSVQQISIPDFYFGTYNNSLSRFNLFLARTLSHASRSFSQVVSPCFTILLTFSTSVFTNSFYKSRAILQNVFQIIAANYLFERSRLHNRIKVKDTILSLSPTDDISQLWNWFDQAKHLFLLLARTSSVLFDRTGDVVFLFRRISNATST